MYADASGDVKDSQMLLDEKQCHLSDLSNSVLVYDCVQTTGRQTGRPMQGRYLRFQYRGNVPLNICEIEIMKHPSTVTHQLFRNRSFNLKFWSRWLRVWNS
jgi:hypothetical protein